jgi:hypothetical protein
MPIVSISMDRLLCSLLIAPKGKKRRTIPITFEVLARSASNVPDSRLLAHSAGSLC